MGRPFDLGDRLATRTLVGFGACLVAVSGVLMLAFARSGIGVVLLLVAAAVCWVRSRLQHLVQLAGLLPAGAALCAYTALHLPRGAAGDPVTASALFPPWGLGLATAGVVVATLGAVLAGRGPRRPTRRWQGRLVTTLAVLPAVTVVVPVVAVVLPARVTAANTMATTTDAPLPKTPKPPKLDGKAAWRATFLADSAAGPVVARRSGIAVVDRATGHVRWRYQRWDRAYPRSAGPSVPTTPDGKTIVALAVRTTAAGGRAGSELQLFDAASGRLLRAWSPAGGRTVVTLLALPSRDRVVVGLRAGAEEEVVAFDRDGDRVWTRGVDPGCAQGPVLAWTSRTLALRCGDTGRLGIDQETGVRRWSNTGDGQRFDALSKPNMPSDTVLALVRTERDGVPNLLGLNTDTGKRRWQANVPACSTTTASTRLVVTVTCAREKRYGYLTGPPGIDLDTPGIPVVARDRKTGKVEWRRNLYGVHDTPIDPQQTPAMPATVLPDGRVLLAYYALVFNGSGMYCAMRPLRPSDGENAGSLQGLPEVGPIYSGGCNPRLTGYRGLLVVTDARGTQAAIR